MSGEPLPPIDVLQYSMLRLRADHEETALALEVGRQIQEFIELNNESGTEPIVAVTVTRGTVSIEVGGIMVFCSEDHDDEDLTLKACMSVYQSEVADLTHIAGKWKSS